MLTLRPFTAADIPFGMTLKEQAGWNQLPGDWRRLLALQPDGGCVAEWDGQPAGTVFVCLFDDVAWISMMLVEASLRGRGIGRRLMEHALAFAESHGAHSIRLDATPLGQPLYERLGFVGDFALARYVGTPQSFEIPEAHGLHPVGFDIDAIAHLDQRVTGANRRRLLELLAREQTIVCAMRDGAVRGYVVSRPGSRAVQIGPCIATAETGTELLTHDLWQHAGQPVLLDIPLNHRAAIDIATAHGLTPARELLRMTRGPRVAEDCWQLWTSSGPEKG